MDPGVPFALAEGQFLVTTKKVVVWRCSPEIIRNVDQGRVVYRFTRQIEWFRGVRLKSRALYPKSYVRWIGEGSSFVSHEQSICLALPT